MWIESIINNLPLLVVEIHNTEQARFIINVLTLLYIVAHVLYSHSRMHRAVDSRRILVANFLGEFDASSLFLAVYGIEADNLHAVQANNNCSVTTYT